MPAKIVVSSGDREEVEYWIEDDVLRIGNDSQCDIPLSSAGGAAHTATVEYLDGAYLVYNRSGSRFEIQGRGVAPGASAFWSNGETLQTQQGDALRMQIEGDPAPSRRPREARYSEPEEEIDDFDPSEAIAEEAPASGSNSAIQIGVTLLCLFAVGALLLYDPSKADGAIAKGPSFTSLIKTLCKPEYAGDRDLNALRDTLQTARIAEARGEISRANSLYDDVRNVLVSRNKLGDCDRETAAKTETKTKAIDCQIWAYVRNHRLVQAGL